MSRRVLRAGALLALILTAGFPAGVSARAVSDSLPDPVLIELRLGRLAYRTVQAVREGDLALLPLGQVFDLAEIRRIPRDTGVEAILQPGNRRIVILPAQGTLRLGTATRRLPTGTLLAHEGEVYLATDVLAELLGSRIVVSWEDLTVTVMDPTVVPLGRRVARDALRTSLPDQGDSPEATLAVPLARDPWDGLVLDYSLLTTNGSVEGATFGTALGAMVLGGSLELGASGTSAAMRTDASWTGVWRENRWLSQLRLGDAFATGPRIRSVRGISASNAPWRRPALLGSVPFEGALGPGWSVEAWRGGRLLAFDSVNALGRFSIDAPIQYGENPVDFIAYGPFGEVREFNRSYRVRADQLPARRMEYGFSLGACRSSLCRWTGNVDLRYGLSTRWSVRAGAERFWRDSLPDLVHPYAAVVGGIGNTWGLEVEAVSNAVLRGAVRYEPSLNARITLEGTRFARDVTDPILTPAGREAQWTLEAFLRPVGAWEGFYLEGGVDHVRGLSGEATSARLGASIHGDGIQFLPTVRLQRSATATGEATHASLLLHTFMLPRPTLGPVFGGLTARTQFEADGSGPLAGAAFLSRLLAPWLRAEAGVAWRRQVPGATINLTLSTQLPTVRAVSTASANPAGFSTSSQFVQGSMLFKDEGRSISFASGPSLQRAGVSGRVFLDANANGRMDAGEEPLTGVRVRIGAWQTTTDATGEYRIWDITPYEPAYVTMDSTSFDSPLWVPAHAAIRLEPGPNRFTQVDLPVLPGGVIEGRVLRAGPSGPIGVGGLTVILRHVTSGVQRRLVTFTDGAFYAIGIPPGEYVIAPDPRGLERLGFEGRPITFTLPPSRDGETVDGLELRLAPRPAP